MEITGKLKRILDVKIINDKLSKRQFVVEYNTDPKYPQLIPFDLFNEKCSLLDGFTAGDDIKVFYNLKGREWKKPGAGDVTYILSLTAWKIEKNSEEDISDDVFSDAEGDVPF
jgi:hypothetical protein